MGTQPWVVVQLDATAIAKISPTPSRVSAVVSQIPRFASMTWAQRRRPCSPSPPTSSWSLTSSSSFPPRLLRPPVFVPTSMRGAYGKPQGLVARVRIGQPLLSVRMKPQHIPAAQEALRRAKFKFPGRQKIFISRKWGFTKFDKDEFQEKLGSGHIITDGVGCQYKPDHGPLAAWKKRMAA